MRLEECRNLTIVPNSVPFHLYFILVPVRHTRAVGTKGVCRIMSASHGSHVAEHEMSTQDTRDGASHQTSHGAVNDASSRARRDDSDGATQAEPRDSDSSTAPSAPAAYNQSQTPIDDSAEEIPSDMTDTFAQMMELRNNNPAMFDRLMRAVQGQSSPLSASSPGPAASRTSRAASSVAGAREASPAQQTFLHVGIKAGSSTGNKSEQKDYTSIEKPSSASLKDEKNNGKPPSSDRSTAAQKPISRDSKEKQVTQVQPQSQSPKQSQVRSSQDTSQSTPTSKRTSGKPIKRPFFSEAGRLSLSRATSHYLSTKAANAGKDFSPESCYNILTPDIGGFENLCKRIEEAGLFIDRREYGRVLVKALQIPSRQSKPSTAPASESPHPQTTPRPASSPIDVPHGLNFPTATPMEQTESTPIVSHSYVPPAMQAPLPGPASQQPPNQYGHSSTNPFTSLPGTKAGTFTLFPSTSNFIPYSSPSSFPFPPPQYTGPPQLTGPGPIPAYTQQQMLRKETPSTGQRPSGQQPISTTTQHPIPGVPGGIRPPSPLPYGALGPGTPPEPRLQRVTPQNQPQLNQFNPTPQGQTRNQGTFQPSQVQPNIPRYDQERGTIFTPQGQPIQIPYYPLPPQLGGPQDGVTLTSINPGVKRHLSAATSSDTKKPRVDQKNVHPPNLPQMSPVQAQLPHGPAAQQGLFMTIPPEPKPRPRPPPPAPTSFTHGVRSRQDIISAINREKALAHMNYNRATIARDVLISSGRHPKEKPLNDHLKKLMENFKFVDYDMDLTTFRWDIVDPVKGSTAPGTENTAALVTEDEKEKDGGDSDRKVAKKRENEADKNSTEKEKENGKDDAKRVDGEEGKGGQEEKEGHKDKESPAAKLLASFLGKAKPGEGDKSGPDTSHALKSRS